MKKVTLSLVIIISLFSCNSVKNMDTSNLSKATVLLSSLNSSSSVQQIVSLFSLLDSNEDKAISTTEAIGSIAEHFMRLDADRNSSLDITELTGLSSLLK
ncbi:hypothetical protein [Psychroserpens sp. NJDZ02]|uniref:hypothetical protein n=1 Tax=Psychroserpens sp. NJDZ02 TaxID=2570561 RepID=UPI0010A8AE0B|nr:hypothetical protein [Psychroserpens sp. NJDZ02]QCE42907.1 hypothetical protein E9099_16300 [Psychroserpens sp. NJDZ02]